MRDGTVKEASVTVRPDDNLRSKTNLPEYDLSACCVVGLFAESIWDNRGYPDQPPSLLHTVCRYSSNRQLDVDFQYPPLTPIIPNYPYVASSVILNRLPNHPFLMVLMHQGIDVVVRDLQHLAVRKPLSPADLDKAKGLMSTLRQMGFTNSEVSELTDGGWSETTVKLYMRGSRTVDSTQKKRLTDFLKELVKRNLSLDDVERTLSNIKSIESRGLDLKDVLNFLSDVEKSKIDLRSLIGFYLDVAISGLTAAQLNQALIYKRGLDAFGISLDRLKAVCQLLEQYGEYDQVVKAILSFGKLKSIEDSIIKLQGEESQLNKNVNDLKRTVQDLEKKIKNIHDAIDLYNRLESEGFSFSILKDLKASSDKYGGMRDFLTAINSYPGLLALQNEVSKLREEKLKVEGKLKELETDHAHLKRVVQICEALLDYGFNISAVETLHSLCRDYGDASTVLEAVGKFGQLTQIQSEIQKRHEEKTGLESRVRELEEQIRKIGDIDAKISESSRTLSQLDQKIKGAKELSMTLDIIERPAEVKNPIAEVLMSELTHLKGLETYVDLHKSQITYSTSLKNKIHELNNLIMERLRDEIGRT